MISEAEFSSLPFFTCEALKYAFAVAKGDIHGVLPNFAFSQTQLIVFDDTKTKFFVLQARNPCLNTPVYRMLYEDQKKIYNFVQCFQNHQSCFVEVNENSLTFTVIIKGTILSITANTHAVGINLEEKLVNCLVNCYSSTDPDSDEENDIFWRFSLIKHELTVFKGCPDNCEMLVQSVENMLVFTCGGVTVTKPNKSKVMLPPNGLKNKLSIEKYLDNTNMHVTISNDAQSKLKKTVLFETLDHHGELEIDPTFVYIEFLN